MNDVEFIQYVLKEYQRVLDEYKEYIQWLEENSELSKWQYPKTRPSKAKLERYGIMVRQSMIKIERGF